MPWSYRTSKSLTKFVQCNIQQPNGPIRINAVAISNYRRHYGTLPSAAKARPKTVADADSSDLLAGKVAIVTGGANGIGFEIARHMLMHCLKAVIIVDKVEDRDNMCCLRKTFGNDRVLFHSGDAGKKGVLDTVFETSRSKFKSIDIVINNAGVLADNDAENTISTNMHAVAVGTYLGIYNMGTHNCRGYGGTIINIIGGIYPTAGSPVYTASRAFILGFTRSISHEYYKATCVRIMGLSPGFTVTKLSNPKLMAPHVGYKEYGNAAQLYADCVKRLEKQNPDAVARTVIEMLELGKHGDLYTVEHCKRNKICYPPWTTLKPMKIAKPKKVIGPCREPFCNPGGVVCEQYPKPFVCCEPPKAATSTCDKPKCCAEEKKDPCKKEDCCKQPDHDPCDKCKPNRGSKK